MSLELAIERKTAALEKNTAMLEKLIELLANPITLDVKPPEVVEAWEATAPKTKRLSKKEVLQAAPVGEFVEEATAPLTEPTANDAPATADAAAPTEPLTYADVSAATIGLIKIRGRDAAIAVLKSFGVTKADQIEEARWPAYLAAVELEKEIPL